MGSIAKFRKKQLGFLAAAVLASAWMPTAQAMPQKPDKITNLDIFDGDTPVNAGDSINGKDLKVILRDGFAKGAVDWGSFGIADGEKVKFSGPENWMILNRVTGIDGKLAPSIIEKGGILDGKGGTVFLVNPAGITFAPGASVEVGSLVASTLDISQNDFLNATNSYTFKQSGDKAGIIRNLADIKASDKGVVALLAQRVYNGFEDLDENGNLLNPVNNTITAGQVVLAAGTEITLSNPNLKENQSWNLVNFDDKISVVVDGVTDTTSLESDFRDKEKVANEKKKNINEEEYNAKLKNYNKAVKARNDKYAEYSAEYANWEEVYAKYKATKVKSEKKALGEEANKLSRNINKIIEDYNALEKKCKEEKEKFSGPEKEYLEAQYKCAEALSKVNNTMDGVFNHGSLIANNGYVLMKAGEARNLISAAINNDGYLKATGLCKDKNGDMVLNIELQGNNIDSFGTLIADNGVINIHGSQIGVGGTLSAKSGVIKIDGNETDAEGNVTKLGGGVAVSGNLSVDGADGKDAGRIDINGETVLIAGTLSANGGNGEINTIAADNLQVYNPNGFVGSDDKETAAIQGGAIVHAKGGTWNLSAAQMNIGNVIHNELDESSSTVNSDLAYVVSSETISDALKDTNVNITATPTKENAGYYADIKVNEPITKSAGEATKLTMTAGRNVVVDAPITSEQGAGALNIDLIAHDNKNRQDGAVVLRADIDTNGGDFTSDGVGTYFGLKDFGKTSDEDGVQGEVVGTTRSITTHGGNINLKGPKVSLATGGTVELNTLNDRGYKEADGSVTIEGTIDSGNGYENMTSEKALSWTEANSKAADKDKKTALAVIGDALEDSVISATVGEGEAFVGAHVVAVETETNDEGVKTLPVTYELQMEDGKVTGVTLSATPKNMGAIYENGKTNTSFQYKTDQLKIVDRNPVTFTVTNDKGNAIVKRYELNEDGERVRENGKEKVEYLYEIDGSADIPKYKNGKPKYEYEEVKSQSLADDGELSGSRGWYEIKGKDGGTGYVRYWAWNGENGEAGTGKIFLVQMGLKEDNGITVIYNQKVDESDYTNFAPEEPIDNWGKSAQLALAVNYNTYNKAETGDVRYSQWDDIDDVNNGRVHTNSNSMYNYVVETELPHSALDIKAGTTNLKKDVGNVAKLGNLTIESSDKITVNGSVQVDNDMVAHAAKSVTVDKFIDAAAGKVDLVAGKDSRIAGQVVAYDNIDGKIDGRDVSDHNVTVAAVTAGKTVSMVADNNVTINGIVTAKADKSAEAPNAVEIIAQDRFINNNKGADSAKAVQAVGKDAVWKIYSNTPDRDTLGELNSKNLAGWGWGNKDGVSYIPTEGNRFIFKHNPTLTYKPADDSKNQDEDYRALHPELNKYSVDNNLGNYKNNFLDGDIEELKTWHPEAWKAKTDSEGYPAGVQPKDGGYDIIMDKDTVPDVSKWGYFVNLGQGKLTIKPKPETEVKPKPETEVKPKPETEVKPKPETEVNPGTENEVTPAPTTVTPVTPVTKETSKATPVTPVVPETPAEPQSSKIVNPGEKPQIYALTTSNLEGSASITQAQKAQGPSTERVLGLQSAELPVFFVKKGQVKNYGTYDVSVDPDKVKMVHTAKVLPEPEQPKNQYRELETELVTGDGSAKFRLTYNGSTLDIYPTDKSSRNLMMADDGENKVEIESQALFKAFNQMGITLDDLDGVYDHFESMKVSSFRH